MTTDKKGYEYAEECDCGLRQKEITESKLQFANIPDAFKDYQLRDFTLSVYKSKESRSLILNACNAVKYWLDNLEKMESNGKGLFIFSETKGSGKTRFAASLANELIQKHKKLVKFTTSVQILDEIRASWDSDEESEAKLLRDLSKADYLVIDDFGTETPKEWVQDRFYSIINNRYTNKKPTIFTSNYALNTMKYDDRITNRITEMCFQIPFAEESVRLNIGKSNMEEVRNAVMGEKK